MRRHLYLAGLLLAFSLAVPTFAQQYSTAPPPFTGSIMTSSRLAPASPSILTRGFGQVDRGTRYSGYQRGSHGSSWGYVPNRGNRDHDGYRHNRRYYGGYYYPYYYGYYGAPFYYESDNSDLPGAGTFNTGQGYVEEPPPGYELRPRSDYIYVPKAGNNSVRDKQDRYGEHYTDSREGAANTEPAHTTLSANGNENSDVTTVLIFKDGYQREVSNYAIMGQYIFVFSGDRRKIPFSEIDVDATKKANENRGNEFNIPSSSNPS